MGGKNLKSVNQYKYLGAVLDTELPDDKDIQRQLRYKYLQETSCEPLLPMFQCSYKCTFSFLLYVHVCITIVVSCMQRLSVAYILDAELYSTCPGERVLVVMTHQVRCNIPTFEALLRKNR